MILRSTFLRSVLACLGFLCEPGLAAPMRDSMGLEAKVALVRNLPLAALDRTLGSERLGEFLDGVGEHGDQIGWREVSGCGSGRLAPEVCLEFLAEGELDTTALLLMGFGLTDSVRPVKPRIYRGEFHKRKLPARHPLRALRSFLMARTPEAYFSFSVVDVRNGNSPEVPYQVTGAASFGKNAQGPLRSAARLLDSLWRADGCGAPSDTFELTMLVLKRKREDIHLVRLTHVDMYQEGSAISRLMSLGRTIANAIPGDCALKLVRIGSPTCP